MKLKESIEQLGLALHDVDIDPQCINVTVKLGALYGCMSLDMEAFLHGLGYAESMFTLELQSLSDEMHCEASLPDGGKLMKLGAPCPIHSNCHMTSISFDKLTYQCSSVDGQHDMPEKPYAQLGARAIPLREANRGQDNRAT